MPQIKITTLLPACNLVDYETISLFHDHSVVRPGTFVVRPGTFVVHPGTFVVRPGTFLMFPETVRAHTVTVRADPGTSMVCPDSF